MKVYKKIIASVFVIVLFLGGVITLNKEDRIASKVENRSLIQKPQLNKQNLKDGSIFTEFDGYFRDQFIGRDKWIELGTKIDMALGKNKYVDVVVGKDEYLLSLNPYYPSVNTEDIQKNVDIAAEEMKELSDYVNNLEGEFLFVGIPKQSYFNSDKYLNYFEDGLEYNAELEHRYFNALNNKNISNINMGSIFKNQKEQLYYKTDHHYNFNGAYLTYYEIIKKLTKLGVKIGDANTKEELGIKSIDKPFYGSWNSKLNWMYDNEDKIFTTTKDFPKYKKYVDGYEDDRIYCYDENDEDVGYGVYMNGNTAEIVITTEREELPNVLIFGDSFTNAVEPLLFPHFNETRILDLRYYKKMNLYQYISDYKPDIVVYISSSDAYALQQGNNLYK